MTRVKFVVARTKDEARKRAAGGFGYDNIDDANQALFEVDYGRKEFEVWRIQVDAEETAHRDRPGYFSNKRPYKRKEPEK